MAERNKRQVKSKLCFNDDTNSDSENDFSSDDSVKDKNYTETNTSDGSSSSSDVEDQNDCNNEAPSTSRDIPITPTKSPPSRWRKKRPHLSVNNKRKSRKNLGHQYVNVTGKVINPRVLGPPCACKKSCRSLLSGKEIDIFNAFWDLGDYNKQNEYLFSKIECLPKKRSYPKKTKRQQSGRKFTYQYSVKVNGMDIKVCKQEFLSVHGLEKSKKRISLICRQISEGLTTPKNDRRGKHNKRPNKYNPEDIKSIVDHIESIPKYVSHYSRTQNPTKVYIDHDLSISRLYTDFYVTWCKDRNIKPASQDKYRRIFCTKFNIGFKLPKSDTCKTCDSLKILLESNENNADTLQKLKLELELHQRRAQAMQQSLKVETENAKSENGRDLISFDLQQALPTPLLTVGPAFYLRKLWTYNLGIHDCKTSTGFMYLWTENIAKRGSEEVASIVYKHFQENPPTSEHLIVYTDNCGGQNKNWLIMSLWLQFVRQGIYKTIEHRFLISGHTCLPSDRDFALIEKYKRNNLQQVYAPEQWYEAIQKCNRKNPFKVTVMEQNDFLSFNDLTASITKKKLCDNKQELKFNDVRCFKFDACNPNCMYVKHAFNEDFKAVAIGKRGLRNINLPVLKQLKQKYDKPVDINYKKLEDIKNLLPYIPPVYHGFFNGLTGTKEMPGDEQNIELLDESEDED